MNWIMYTIQWSYTFLAFINFAFHTFMQSPNKITTGLLVEKLNTVNRNKIGAVFIQLQMVQMMACSPNHVVTKCCNSRVWDEINHPFPNFHGEVGEWRSNFNQHLTDTWLHSHAGVKVKPVWNTWKGEENVLHIRRIFAAGCIVLNCLFSA